MTTERPRDVPFGIPSVEALEMATDAMRRRYVLPETMQHPQVKSECMCLAYLIQAYGLATTPSPRREVRAVAGADDQRECESPAVVKTQAPSSVRSGEVEPIRLRFAATPLASG